MWKDSNFKTLGVEEQEEQEEVEEWGKANEGTI